MEIGNLSSKSKFKRFSASIAASTGITMGLFLCMHSLSANDEIVIEEPRKPVIFDIVGKIEETPPIKKPREELPQPPEVKDLPPVTLPPTGDDDPNIITLLPPKPLEPIVDDNPNVNFNETSPMMVLAAQQPDYPESAISRGIEGYCKVSFTVMHDGTVDPASISVEQEEPARIFTRSCIKAIKKFKFKPAVKDGNAYAVHNVIYKFQFNLADK